MGTHRYALEKLRPEFIKEYADQARENLKTTGTFWRSYFLIWQMSGREHAKFYWAIVTPNYGMLNRLRKNKGLVKKQVQNDTRWVFCMHKSNKAFMLLSAFGIIFALDSHCGAVLGFARLFPYDSFLCPCLSLFQGIFSKVVGIPFKNISSSLRRSSRN